MDTGKVIVYSKNNEDRAKEVCVFTLIMSSLLEGYLVCIGME